MGDTFEVQEILGSRKTADGEIEYKIRWKEFSPMEDTWEPEENLLDCEEILSDYKKNMAAEQRTKGQNQTTESTPISQRTRLRQRNTPKVQRVLGVKQMPSQVNWSEFSMESERTKRIPHERPLRHLKWAMCGGLLCILTAAILLYLTMD
ncbi:chromodomain Y-like protein 2 [Strongylocentrotus purpuratus]|uniref:Chromo domain-containing protein n=1 Tax=Strongylocentrotus purpuratus TaxID=7668 RepID=A0A7M7RCQ4_STRPU|nr:chromodomain Y-like protein 2 [Strongylocentrotus purpuratus]